MEAPYQHFEDEASLLSHTAQLLAEGKVVGWFHGRMEFGARALGNRSILASPLNPYSTENLNIFIKHREPFRKFAAVKTGAGAKNSLRVTTNGSSIVAYVNGEKFASVRGQLPEGGGAVGLYAQSEKNTRDTWKFTGLKVTEHAQ